MVNMNDEDAEKDTGVRKRRFSKMEDFEVIEIRHRLREGSVSVTELMKLYKRTRLSIYNAAKGDTFKHLNEQYPPVEAIEYRREDQKILPSDHAKIAQRYYEGETQQEIADSFCVDITYICRIIAEQRQPT